MNRCLESKLISAIFLGLLLTSSFSFINSALAPSSGLTLKWEVNLGSYADTFIAPLSCVVNGRTEIITTGSNQDYGTAGLVTALDGATGKIIWQVQPGGIGSHTPFEIADINNDGIPEIVISAQGGALCLFANNGSTYWKNPNAPSEENYPAIADVNNDGYDEVFVSRGYGPYNGYD
jgi:outer membrane protein assembly factor BamB